MANIKPYFNGNQYFMSVFKIYKDVRLVGAPPSAIGKFGGDTDNWMWPRHTGDFSVLRIYADANNEPAAYSADNKPYRPATFFKISNKGIQEGDFTMVFGYPGTTNEYLTSYAIEQLQNIENPHKIAIRTAKLNIINDAMESDQICFQSCQCCECLEKVAGRNQRAEKIQYDCLETTAGKRISTMGCR